MLTALERLLLLFSVITLLAPAAADAQLTPSPGDRVRITQIDGSVHTGELRMSSSSDVQILDDDLNRALIIPSAEVAGLERSLGKQGSFSKTFFTTVGIGAGVGFLLVGPFIPVCESYGPCSPGSRGTAMVQGMALVGLAAIPIGIVAGVVRKTERWAPTNWGGEISVVPSLGLAPDGAVQLSIGVPFGGGS